VVTKVIRIVGMNLVTLEAGAKLELLLIKQRWVCCTSRSDLSTTTKCDQNYISHICKLITPKTQAKHEHLFNEPASGLSFSFSKII
jgi:hypothetical protein